MSLRDLIQEVESHEFSGKLNMASDFRLFLRLANREESVRSLVGTMRSSGDHTEEILGRINDLTHLSIDPRYEHPYDAALAVYLWALYFAGSELSFSAANLVDGAPQCWYSKKLARRILEPIPDSVDNLSTGESDDSPRTSNLFATEGIVRAPLLRHWDLSGGRVTKDRTEIENIETEMAL